MKKYDVYEDISSRTGGDIYIGVVGPVRTGKSTFISKIMNEFVIPNIDDKLKKQIATDEMPQSADGKMVMTTQPKFIPAEAVKVNLGKKSTANVRLVDCVGFLVDGAIGIEEDGKVRKVKTPWSKDEMPFEKAAEIGTQKVIRDYSTIGVLVTTDGSFTDIARDNYVLAEEKTVKELKKAGKPFVIVLNCKNPTSKENIALSGSMEEKYGVPVVSVDVTVLNSSDISDILSKVLMEFPMNSININIPRWMQALPYDSDIIEDLLYKVKDVTQGIEKVRDYTCLDDVFNDDQDYQPISLSELRLGEGIADYSCSVKDGFYYKVLSKQCGENIEDDYDLMNYIKEFSDSKRKYAKIKDALLSAENDGYGIVAPSVDEMNLEEPVLVKQGGRCGVKLKASAPSLHIMKVDVSTEVAPLVGTEKQGEDLVNFIMNKFEDNPAGIWETDIFGKSLHDLMNEGLTGKINAMPKEMQGKMRKTVSRIVNENKGGVICILL